jgi:rRNA maturation endonuclease Nob1
MDNKTAVKIMLCEMVIKSKDVKDQSEIDMLTNDIANRIDKLYAKKVKCWNCGVMFNKPNNEELFACHVCGSEN